jgi:hypothetical protein
VNGTWNIVEQPDGANIVGSKWVFKLKWMETGEVEKYKVRLVVQGYMQVPGIDYFDTFAPVAKMSSTQAILAVVAVNGWLVDQMDVKSAYLNGVLPDDKVIFMCTPPSFEFAAPGQPDHVLWLKKALYSLKQSGCLWYKTFCNALEWHGLMQCKVDHAIFYWHSEAGILLLLVHIDDLLMVASSSAIMMDIKKHLEIKFKMTDLGPVHWHIVPPQICLDLNSR